LSARSPLSCKEAAELVTDAMEGALPADTQDRFTEHLGRCEACRTFAEQIAQTIEVLRMLPRDRGPEPAERVLAAFRKRQGAS
jgi:predicted anti-sigma-YlaC factor YlaD